MLGADVSRRAGQAAGDDDLVVVFAEGGGVGRGFEEDGVGKDLGTEVLVVHCAWALVSIEYERRAGERKTDEEEY